MLNVLYTIIGLLLFSCATNKEEKELVAWEAWENRPIEEVRNHPYFKLLPVTKVKHKDGLETWIIRDQTRFQTDAYCQSLGGCMGMPVYNCDNTFSVQDGIVKGFEQSGNCPGLKTIEARKK